MGRLSMKVAAAEFERLAIEQMDTLYRVARRLARDGTRAEDLVQETYLRALRGRERFELGEFGIRPWLLRILRNVYLSKGEREAKQPMGVEDASVLSDAAVVEMAATYDWDRREGMDERLVKALDELPPEYAAVLTLWAVEEMSYKEIAEALEVPIGTVMSRLFRARERLAGQLQELAAEKRIV